MAGGGKLGMAGGGGLGMAGGGEHRTLRAFRATTQGCGARHRPPSPPQTSVVSLQTSTLLLRTVLGQSLVAVRKRGARDTGSNVFIVEPKNGGGLAAAEIEREDANASPRYRFSTRNPE
jgi:hypothetical protein